MEYDLGICDSDSGKFLYGTPYLPFYVSSKKILQPTTSDTTSWSMRLLIYPSRPYGRRIMLRPSLRCPAPRGMLVDFPLESAPNVKSIFSRITWGIRVSGKDESILLAPCRIRVIFQYGPYSNHSKMNSLRNKRRWNYRRWGTVCKASQSRLYPSRYPYLGTTDVLVYVHLWSFTVSSHIPQYLSSDNFTRSR